MTPNIQELIKQAQEGQDATAQGLAHEVQRLHALINTPELFDFDRAVQLESAHQKERWGDKHDSAKEPQDWFWLVGYLAGKCWRRAWGKRRKTQEEVEVGDRGCSPASKARRPASSCEIGGKVRLRAGR